MPKRINYIAPFTWKSRSSPLPKGAGPCLLGDYWVRFAGFEKPLKSLILMVPLPRLERGTPRSTIWCSNQLSYSGVCKAAINSVFGQTSSAQIRYRLTENAPLSRLRVAVPVAGPRTAIAGHRPSAARLPFSLYGEVHKPEHGSCTSGRNA